MIAGVSSRIALICALVLGVPYLAYAECAWVVWLNALNPPPSESEKWRPVDSYTTPAPCRTAAFAANEKMRGNEGEYKFNYVCLPDTVDPRGPKGK